MRTTLNLPDEVAREARRRAVEEGTTLTKLIVEGLSCRLAQGRARRPLPVSTAAGGVRPGVSWSRLAADRDDQSHR